MLKNIQDEQRLGQHKGILDVDEFSYLYLFLDWTNEKKKRRVMKEEEQEAKKKEEEK